MKGSVSLALYAWGWGRWLDFGWWWAWSVVGEGQPATILAGSVLKPGLDLAQVVRIHLGKIFIKVWRHKIFL